MPFIAATAVLVLFFPGAHGVASAADVSRASIAVDCRVEGAALGIKPGDLNQYVRECIKEFLEPRKITWITKVHASPWRTW